jgi:gluconokinase
MILLLMGVTGSGKTTIGTLVAGRLGWIFLDADDFHSAANKAKMHSGIPLNDDDRRPWLAAIHEELVRRTGRAENIVLACSALKQWYREILSAGLDMKIVYLKDTFEDLERRIEHRQGHFAGTGILPGQFADLEEPRNALVVDASQPPDRVVNEILGRLDLS